MVRFLSPGDESVVSNPVTFSFEGSGIHTLVLKAESWKIRQWAPASETWSTTYTFLGTDTPRLMRVQGLDEEGRVIAEDEIGIVVSSGAGDALDVPYFYQYDNAYEGWATCGITSAAMLINYWRPGAVTPDALYVEYGKSQGQSPSTLAQLYRWEGLSASYVTNGTRGQIRGHLDAGRPVVAHGFWTGSGHIATIIGHDSNGWIVHDPAGDWEVCYGCGSGAEVHYAYGGGWDGRLSHDGDIWFSTADVVSY